MNTWLKTDDYRTLPKTPGVYVLANDKGDVIYVGQSANMWLRFYRSHPYKKLADWFLYTETEDNIRLEVETTLKYNPPLNKLIGYRKRSFYETD